MFGPIFIFFILSLHDICYFLIGLHHMFETLMLRLIDHSQQSCQRYHCFFWWIVSYGCKQYGEIIANSLSPYQIVIALYCNQYYYGLINIINVYTYDLLIFSSKYAINNGTGRQFGIVVHYFESQALYISIINIMVLVISQILYSLLTIGFPCLNLFTVQKIINKTLEASFGILGVSTEPKNDLRVKPIFESKIGFLL